jgi:hypothetical protein
MDAVAAISMGAWGAPDVLSVDVQRRGSTAGFRSYPDIVPQEIRSSL